MVFATVAFGRNSTWKNEDTIWGDTISKSPLLFRAHNNRGMFYAMQGSLSKAAADFKRAIELNPYDVPTMGNLANAYLMLGRIDDGIDIYRKIFELTPEAHDLRINLAVAYQARGMYREARAELDEYLKWYPGDMRAVQMSRSLPY